MYELKKVVKNIGFTFCIATITFCLKLKSQVGNPSFLVEISISHSAYQSEAVNMVVSEILLKTSIAAPVKIINPTYLSGYCHHCQRYSTGSCHAHS